MAEFYEIEDAILNQFGLFIKEATKSLTLPDGVKMFLLDRDWPRVTEEYIGIQLTNTKRNGRAYYPEELDGSGRQVAVNYYEVLLEIMSFRGRPTSRLTQITHSLEHTHLKGKYLSDFGIGVSQVSSVSKADTVLDGVEKELRARMTLVLNIAISDADPIPTNFATSIFINAKTNEEVYGVNTLDFSMNPTWIYTVSPDTITTSNIIYEYINYTLPTTDTWSNTWL